MTTRSTFSKAGLTAVAGVMTLTAALSAPSFAAAQSSYYGGRSDYSYDPCRRDTTNRATTGGVLGALAGAAIGSNVAGHHVRTEGAVLGGIAGAVAGAVIGKSAAACQTGQTRNGSAYYNNNRDYGDGYGYGRGDSYYSRGSARQTYGGQGYDYDRSRYYSDDNDGYSDRNGGDRYRVTQGRADANGCTLAESPIYLPDGRVQKRFVRVCQDSSGRYQVVE